MSEHRYTAEERITQLTRLAAALREAIPAVALHSPVAHRDVEFRAALAECERLLQTGFTQEELSTLSRAVPNLFPRYKDWMPPMERAPNGQLFEAPWFAELDAKLQPVVHAAGKLREVGYY